jgi:hypothetical protein
VCQETTAHTPAEPTRTALPRVEDEREGAVTSRRTMAIKAILHFSISSKIPPIKHIKKTDPYCLISLAS